MFCREIVFCDVATSLNELFLLLAFAKISRIKELKDIIPLKERDFAWLEALKTIFHFPLESKFFGGKGSKWFYHQLSC